MKILKRTLLVSLLAVMCALAFAGCDLFGSDLSKGKKMLKSASNKETTKTVVQESTGGTMMTKQTTYMRDGDVIYVKVEPTSEVFTSVETSTSWYIKEGDTYSVVTDGSKTSTTKETYDKMLSYTSTGDLTGETDRYEGSDTYDFGFRTEGDIKYFVVIWGGRSTVASYGFEGKQLVSKTSQYSSAYRYYYDEQTVPSVPNV